MNTRIHALMTVMTAPIGTRHRANRLPSFTAFAYGPIDVVRTLATATRSLMSRVVTHAARCGAAQAIHRHISFGLWSEIPRTWV